MNKSIQRQGFTHLMIVLFLAALTIAGLAFWRVQSTNNDVQPNNSELVPQETKGPENNQATDKQGIDLAVNKYCQELARYYGFAGMKTGYIIADRFSEEVLSDSPQLLRFKQVGAAASATVDCEDAEGPIGISNDLLFVKNGETWEYVDEVQNNTNSGFLCPVVDKYAVSKDLVSVCLPAVGSDSVTR